MSDHESPDKTIFIIGPIGDKNRGHVENITRSVQAAVQDLGYKTLHSKDIALPGVVVNQVIKQLVEADIVIADLTTGNANVFYETAIRHAVKKPTIHVIEKDQQLPFDIKGVRTIAFDTDKPFDLQDEIKESVIATSKPGYEFETPFKHALLRKAFDDIADPQEQIIAKFLDTQQVRIDDQMAGLAKLIRQLEDTTRKPLRGIDEVFAQMYFMLERARVGGNVWFVGMTLAVGPAHRYRGPSHDPNDAGPDDSEVESQLTTMDDLLQYKWPTELPKFEEMIEEMHERLCEIVEKATNPVVVCLNSKLIDDKFLNKLALREHYSALGDEIESVAEEIDELHKAVEKKVDNDKPITYVDSIPLQILVVELPDASPLAVNRRACMVFHVGTGNIGTRVLDDGETGFYSELEPVVNIFERMAESLWQGGHIPPSMREDVKRAVRRGN